MSGPGLFMIAEPSVYFIFDCMFLGRNTKVLQILGCIVALLAIYGAIRLERKRKTGSRGGK